MRTKYDQFVHDVRELNKIRLKISGKEVDMRLKGTYAEIKKQYRQLARKLHEDELIKLKNEGEIEDEDIEIAKKAMRFLNGVYSYIVDEKRSKNRNDNEVCTLIDNILVPADKSRSTSRSGGASSGPRSSGNASYASGTSGRTSSGSNSSGPNYSRSGRSTNGTNNSRQSGGQQRSQSGTNQRSSSGSSNSGRQTGSTSSNQQTRSSSSNKDSDTITFSTGTLKKVLDGKKAPKRHEAFNNLYEYEFTKKNGDKYIIYSENTFEELSKPDIKSKVESYLLGSLSLRYAASYDVQNEDSRYGYVGRMEKSYYGEYSYHKDTSLIAKLRSRKLKDVQELKFNGGTLKRLFDKNGNPKTLEGISNVYEYEYTDRSGKVHTIYTENTFEELSKPDIKSKVESYLLGSLSLRYAASYDVQNEDSRYGYVGRMEKSYYGEYSYHKDTSLIAKLRNRQMSKKKLNVTIAMDDINTQKTITLRDGRKLYGYRLFDAKKTEDPGKELYIEDDPMELARKMNGLKTNKGFTHAKMMYAFDRALQKAYDFLTDSKRAQFGYAGSLRDDGEFEVNKQIVEELRDRIKVIAARSEFISLAGKEDKLLEELRKSER